MNEDRVQRLLRLASLLHTGQSYSARDLCDSLSVSRRTLFRDLGVLKSAGLRCFYDNKQKSFTTESALLLRPISLTAAEAPALLLVTHKVLPDAVLPNAQVAREAATKVANLLPPPLRADCRALLDGET